MHFSTIITYNHFRVVPVVHTASIGFRDVFEQKNVQKDESYSLEKFNSHYLCMRGVMTKRHDFSKRIRHDKRWAGCVDVIRDPKRLLDRCRSRKFYFLSIGHIGLIIIIFYYYLSLHCETNQKRKELRFSVQPSNR